MFCVMFYTVVAIRLVYMFAAYTKATWIKIIIIIIIISQMIIDDSQ